MRRDGKAVEQQYLYALRPARVGMVSEEPTAEEAAAIGRHFAYLQDLLASGVLILAGRTLDTDERCFGIAIIRAAGDAEAREVMLRDPAVAEGIMRGELHPYRVALICEANASSP